MTDQIAKISLENLINRTPLEVITHLERKSLPKDVDEPYREIYTRVQQFQRFEAAGFDTFKMLDIKYLAPDPDPLRRIARQFFYTGSYCILLYIIDETNKPTDGQFIGISASLPKLMIAFDLLPKKLEKNLNPTYIVYARSFNINGITVVDPTNGDYECKINSRNFLMVNGHKKQVGDKEMEEQRKLIEGILIPKK